MSTKRPSTRETIATNLRTLMLAREMKQQELAKKSGVSQRQISNILNRQTGCGIEAADAIAKVFGLNGWHLLIPNLPKELIASPTLSKLMDSYIHASPDGREMIDRVAEREAAYTRK